MNKLIFLILLLGIILAIDLDAFSQTGPGPKDMHHGERFPSHDRGMHHDGFRHRGLFFGDPQVMKEKFGLSDEQVEKIGIINNDYRKKLLTIRDSMEPKKIKLHGLLTDDNINLNDVRSLLEEISKFEVEIRMLRIKHILEIEKVLTPDQKKQLRNSIRQMMGYLIKTKNKCLRENDSIYFN